MVNRNEEVDSDDELDRSWVVTSSPSKDQMLPLLECPVCFHIPLPPVRTCTLGHILCSICCKKLTGCPLCLQPIGTGRSFFAEAFLESCTMKCKFAQDGCQLEMKGEKLKNHLELCNFRPIRCTRCGYKVSFQNFERHLVREHEIGRWDLDDGGTRILLAAKRQTARFKIEILEAFSHDFLHKTLFAVLAVSLLADILLTST